MPDLNRFNKRPQNGVDYFVNDALDACGRAPVSSWLSRMVTRARHLL
jgi:hypothetical protein